MKRVLSFFLAALLCFSLCACDTANEHDAATQPPTHNNGDQSTGVHTHAWINATCTDPKTCATCGATEGSAAAHEWIAATCTASKTCAHCGATEGSPAEHSWLDASCTAPQTCSVCGQTSGAPAEHTYSDGKCTACGAQDPRDTSEQMVWIPTKGGKKYHSKSTCSGMKDPKQVTEAEAIQQGYTPCSRCH